jgi:sugar/nucleoside kinase (ribokinase family)
MRNMSQHVRLVSVGDVFVDVLVAGSGHDAAVRLAPGGSAVNAALSATVSGAAVEVCGRIGDDAGGRMIQTELAARGVRASLAVDPDRPTGTFVMVGGEIRVDRGANVGFLPEHLAQAFEADATLVSGYLPAPTVTAALLRSHAAWNALAVAHLAQLPDAANAVFMNADEARKVTGTDPDDAVRVLSERYRLVCVTLGASGAIGALGGQVESVAAEPRAPGGRPGAGDAFAAATLVTLAAGASLSDALVVGCRAGAFALDG